MTDELQCVLSFVVIVLSSSLFDFSSTDGIALSPINFPFLSLDCVTLYKCGLLSVIIKAWSYKSTNNSTRSKLFLTDTFS